MKSPLDWKGRRGLKSSKSTLGNTSETTIKKKVRNTHFIQPEDVHDHRIDRLLVYTSELQSISMWLHAVQGCVPVLRATRRVDVILQMKILGICTARPNLRHDLLAKFNVVQSLATKVPGQQSLLCFSQSRECCSSKIGWYRECFARAIASSWFEASLNHGRTSVPGQAWHQNP